MKALPWICILGLLLAVAFSGCASEKSVYVVKSGDQSLEQIAEKVYPGRSPERMASFIAEANPELKDQPLQPGMQLVMPEMQDETGAAVRPDPEQCDRAKVYR